MNQQNRRPEGVEKTKDLYLYTALKLFAKRGYKAVTVAQIAQEMGVTAPALYKHYKNKQELFEAILEESKKGYDESIEKVKGEIIPEDFTVEMQIERAQSLFHYVLHDRWLGLFRKLMLVEQFNMPELSALYNERYINLQIMHYAKILKAMMDKGLYVQGDPEILATAYYSPVLVQLEYCDRNPEAEENALKVIERHIREFNRIYRIK